MFKRNKNQRYATDSEAGVTSREFKRRSCSSYLNGSNYSRNLLDLHIFIPRAEDSFEQMKIVSRPIEFIRQIAWLECTSSIKIVFACTVMHFSWMFMQKRMLSDFTKPRFCIKWWRNHLQVDSLCITHKCALRKTNEERVSPPFDRFKLNFVNAFLNSNYAKNQSHSRSYMNFEILHCTIENGFWFF